MASLPRCGQMEAQAAPLCTRPRNTAKWRQASQSRSSLTSRQQALLAGSTTDPNRAQVRPPCPVVYVIPAGRLGLGVVRDPQTPHSTEDAPPFPAAAVEPGLELLVWHPADNIMKPIVGNRRIERPLESAFDGAALPLTALVSPHSAPPRLAASQAGTCRAGGATEQPPAAPRASATPALRGLYVQRPASLAALTATARQAYVASLCHALTGSAQQAQQMAVLGYVETLAAEPAATHAVLSSELALLLVSAARW